MSTATITSKGQMTIPQDARKRLGLREGDKVEVVVQENGTALLIPRRSALDLLKNCLPRPKRRLSLEEIERGIAAHAAERDRRSRE